MGELLQSEAFWKVLAMVVAIIWSLPAIQKWRSKIRQGQMGLAAELMEEAVIGIWMERTRKLKAENGNLTEDNIVETQNLAFDRFKEIATARAPKVLKGITDEFIKTGLQCAYGKFKVRTGE